MPPPREPEQVRVRFDVGTLDERIAMRAELAELRSDPCVIRVDPAPNYRLGFYDIVLNPDVDETRNVRRVRDRYGPYPRENHARIDLSFERQPTDPNATISPETRERILQQYLANPGRRQLSSGFATPLRQRIDYHAAARRTFLVEDMPQGALPVYDRDPQRENPQLAKPMEPLPEWCVVGTWVQDGPIIGIITEVLTLTVTLAVWRQYCSDQRPRTVVRHRTDVPRFKVLPGEPEAPRTVYQRLLDDDLGLG